MTKQSDPNMDDTDKSTPKALARPKTKPLWSQISKPNHFGQKRWRVISKINKTKQVQHQTRFAQTTVQSQERFGQNHSEVIFPRHIPGTYRGARMGAAHGRRAESCKERSAGLAELRGFDAPESCEPQPDQTSGRARGRQRGVLIEKPL